jgi:hypothetical protein
VFAALAVAFALGGCSSTKPDEERCRLAVDNIRAINRLDDADVGARPEAMVRSCRAQSSRDAVECMIAAKTVEDLQKCEGDVGADYYEREREAEEAKKSDKSETSEDDDK